MMTTSRSETIIARRKAFFLPMTRPAFKVAATCPGFKKYLSDSILLQASRIHLEILRRELPDYIIEDCDGTVASLELTIVPIAPYKRSTVPTIIPFKHQDEALAIANSRETFLFQDDMGTGKSHEICNIAAEQYNTRLIDRAIIVTKKRAVPQFLNVQIPKHIPIENYRAFAFPVAKTKYEKIVQYPGDNLLLMVAPWSAFTSKAQTKRIAEFAKSGKTAIFLDECQAAKTYSSETVSNLWKIRPYLIRRYLFSGEPAPKGMEDLYSQYMFMDPNILGHETLTSFKSMYCIFGGYKAKEIVGYKEKEDFAEKTAPFTRVTKIDDIQDMPERSWHKGKFEPSDEQRRLYKEMTDDFCATVEIARNEKKKEIVTRLCKNAATKFTILQQIANGWFYANPSEDGEKGELVRISNERALYVAEELVGSLPKCLVWARFHADLDCLKEAFDEFGIEAVEFSGRLTDSQNETNKMRFINDSKVRVFYGTEASGGEALDGLQVASRAVYFSSTFNWGHRIQSERRIWRTGQKNHCQYWDVRGFPIDTLIRANHHKKEDTAEELKTLTGLAKLVEELREVKDG